MGDEQFDDLKQFIETTVSQSELHLKDELVGESVFKKELKNFRQEMHEGFAGIGETISALIDHIDSHADKADRLLDDHETRITKLEQAA
jgi:hypothetical protein